MLSRTERDALDRLAHRAVEDDLGPAVGRSIRDAAATIRAALREVDPPPSDPLSLAYAEGYLAGAGGVADWLDEWGTNLENNTPPKEEQ